MDGRPYCRLMGGRALWTAISHVAAEQSSETTHLIVGASVLCCSAGLLGLERMPASRRYMCDVVRSLRKSWAQELAGMEGVDFGEGKL